MRNQLREAYVEVPSTITSLAAARKARAQSLYTLSIGDFQAFYRTGDPKIVKP